MRCLCIGLTILFSASVFAQTSKIQQPKANKKSLNEVFGSRSVGHLVTSNNNVLNKGDITVGTLYVAYGATDNLSFGISPFALLSFNAVNYMGRYAWDMNRRSRLGVDVAYFSTFNENYQDQYLNFKMEVWTGKLTANYLIRNWYRVNLTASHFYYVDDERPFSLRMDPQNRDRYASNLTSLHEIRFSRNIFLNLEGGFWGLNYKYPYLHGGATLNLQNDNLLLGVGASTTYSPGFPAEKAKMFAGYDSRQSIHPEFQIQAFF